jgi:hypothetical protein
MQTLTATTHSTQAGDRSNQAGDLKPEPSSPGNRSCEPATGENIENASGGNLLPEPSSPGDLAYLRCVNGLYQLGEGK